MDTDPSPPKNAHQTGIIRTATDVTAGLTVLVATDRRLAYVREQVDEVPLRLRPPGFAGLAGIIVAQQVSRASAQAITDRLERLIDPLEPETYLAAGEQAWREAGLSRAKQAALAASARAICNRQLDLEDIAARPVDEAVAALTAIKGIGPWTAQVYLLFCAGHGDIFPAGDLALQEAAKVALELPARPSADELAAMARAWTPHRGIAARLLWAYYAVLRDGRDGMPI